MNNLQNNAKINKPEVYKVVRQWYNSFAQNCYELEDGTKIYIDYDEERITIEKGEQ